MRNLVRRRGDLRSGVFILGLSSTGRHGPVEQTTAGTGAWAWAATGRRQVADHETIRPCSPAWRTNRVYPDLSGGNYAVTNLYIDNTGAQDYDFIYPPEGGSLSSKRRGPDARAADATSSSARSTSPAGQHVDPAWDNVANKRRASPRAHRCTGTLGWHRRSASSPPMRRPRSAATRPGQQPQHLARRIALAICGRKAPQGITPSPWPLRRRSQPGTLTLGPDLILRVPPFEAVTGRACSSAHHRRDVKWKRNIAIPLVITGFGASIRGRAAKYLPLTATQGTAQWSGSRAACT